IAKRVDSIAQTARKTVEFPNDYRLDLPSEDVGLQADEFRPVKVVPRVLVHIIGSIGNAIPGNPLVDFGALSGFILAHGADADVNGCLHGAFPQSGVTLEVYTKWRNSQVRNDMS